MKKVLLLLTLTLSTTLFALTAETKAQVQAAILKGVRFLQTQQAESGAFSDARFPGMTGLALSAFATTRSLPQADQASIRAVTQKAAAFILTKSQPDGGFYQPIPGRKGSGLGNYNTCLCMVALHDLNPIQFARPIQKARGYVASTQLEAAGIHEGGFGYDKEAQRAYTDLNNTFYAVDAMARTASVEEARPAGEKHVDIDWEAAKAYLLSLQSKEGTDKGGFWYNKIDPKAGFKKGPKAKQDQTAKASPDKPKFRAYGSMSYAGLLSMLHAKMSPTDPRILSTLDYVTRFWTLEENPNMGVQGLYFYYNVLTRALSAAGKTTLATKPSPTDWRESMAKKIIAIQRPNGSWYNDNNRFWESDPVLCTAYGILSLNIILSE